MQLFIFDGCVFIIGALNSVYSAQRMFSDANIGKRNASIQASSMRLLRTLYFFE